MRIAEPLALPTQADSFPEARSTLRLPETTGGANARACKQRNEGVQPPNQGKATCFSCVEPFASLVLYNVFNFRFVNHCFARVP
jgi:hypothetical protein